MILLYCFDSYIFNNLAIKVDIYIKNNYFVDKINIVYNRIFIHKTLKEKYFLLI